MEDLQKSELLKEKAMLLKEAEGLAKLLEQLEEEAQELIDFGDSKEKAKGYGIKRTAEAIRKQYPSLLATTVVAEKFARICTATGQGMNEGFCFGDGEAYFKEESDALNYAKSIGYTTLQEAYDNEAYYWTEWEDEEEMKTIEELLAEEDN